MNFLPLTPIAFEDKIHKNTSQLFHCLSARSSLAFYLFSFSLDFQVQHFSNHCPKTRRGLLAPQINFPFNCQTPDLLHEAAAKIALLFSSAWKKRFFNLLPVTAYESCCERKKPFTHQTWKFTWKHFENSKRGSGKISILFCCV